MTGESLLPDGFCASVYIKWPETLEWKLLGVVSNCKPSAFFRVKGQLKESNLPADLGISIEPTISSNLQIVQLGQESTSENTPLKLLENLFNYCSSFVDKPDGAIPVSIFQNWYHNTLKKIRMDPKYM